MHKQLAETHNPQAHTLLQRQIEAVDRQFDLSACGHAQAGRRVYELYGLTEEKIRVTALFRRCNV